MLVNVSSGFRNKRRRLMIRHPQRVTADPCARETELLLCSEFLCGKREEVCEGAGQKTGIADDQRFQLHTGSSNDGSLWLCLEISSTVDTSQHDWEAIIEKVYLHQYKHDHFS